MQDDLLLQTVDQHAFRPRPCSRLDHEKHEKVNVTAFWTEHSSFLSRVWYQQSGLAQVRELLNTGWRSTNDVLLGNATDNSMHVVYRAFREANFPIHADTAQHFCVV